MPTQDVVNLVVSVMAAGLDAMVFKLVDSIVPADDDRAQSHLQTALYEALAKGFQEKAGLSRMMSGEGERS
jgi:hypothetical protein